MQSLVTDHSETEFIHDPCVDLNDELFRTVDVTELDVGKQSTAIPNYFAKDTIDMIIHATEFFIFSSWDFQSIREDDIKNIQIPSFFLCPIFATPFKSPVMTLAGQTYE